MKFVTVILTLLAVLAQSVPTKFDEELPTSGIIAEFRAKIRTEYDDLRNAFFDADIDPVLYLCPEYIDLRLLNTVGSNLALRGKISSFFKLVLQTSLSDRDFFCSPSEESPDPNENFILTTEIEDLIRAFEDAHIDPADYFCLDNDDSFCLDYDDSFSRDHPRTIATRKLISNQDLYSKFSRVTKVLLRYFISDRYFFCTP